ncbi:MAG: DUF805 domain-containing protein [Succinivibrio sp.]
MKRASYSVCFILTTFVLIILSMVATAISSRLDHQTVMGVEAVRFIVVVVFLIVCAAPRIKDLGKNPWLALLGLMPLFGCCYLLYLCFAKRDDSKAESVKVSILENNKNSIIQTGDQKVQKQDTDNSVNHNQNSSSSQKSKSTADVINDGSTDARDYTKLIK